MRKRKYSIYMVITLLAVLLLTGCAGKTSRKVISTQEPEAPKASQMQESEEIPAETETEPEIDVTALETVYTTDTVNAIHRCTGGGETGTSHGGSENFG